MNIQIETILEKCVENMKINIEAYFKYKSGYNKHRNPRVMRYFDCENIRDLKNPDSTKRDLFCMHKYNVQMEPQD